MVKSSDVILILVSRAYPPWRMFEKWTVLRNSKRSPFFSHPLRLVSLQDVAVICSLTFSWQCTSYRTNYILIIVWMVYLSLGYIPGHIHAFWLIYKKMQAEEQYGNAGFLCELITLITSFDPPCWYQTTDVGNGQYQPLYSEGPHHHPHAPSYGATGR